MLRPPGQKQQEATDALGLEGRGKGQLPEAGRSQGHSATSTVPRQSGTT